MRPVQDPSHTLDPAHAPAGLEHADHTALAPAGSGHTIHTAPSLPGQGQAPHAVEGPAQPSWNELWIQNVGGGWREEGPEAQSGCLYAVHLAYEPILHHFSGPQGRWV